jgi:predicted site-specific integrase-resolvase
MQKDQENRQAGLAAMNERQAALVLGVSIRTLQQWRLKGRGPSYVRPGGRAIRYLLPDLHEYLEQNRVSTC